MHQFERRLRGRLMRKSPLHLRAPLSALPHVQTCLDLILVNLKFVKLSIQIQSSYYTLV